MFFFFVHHAGPKEALEDLVARAPICRLACVGGYVLQVLAERAQAAEAELAGVKKALEAERAALATASARLSELQAAEAPLRVYASHPRWIDSRSGYMLSSLI